MSSIVEALSSFAVCNRVPKWGLQREASGYLFAQAAINSSRSISP